MTEECVVKMKPRVQVRDFLDVLSDGNIGLLFSFLDIESACSLEITSRQYAFRVNGLGSNAYKEIVQMKWPFAASKGGVGMINWKERFKALCGRYNAHEMKHPVLTLLDIQNRYDFFFEIKAAPNATNSDRLYNPKDFEVSGASSILCAARIEGSVLGTIDICSSFPQPFRLPASRSYRLLFTILVKDKQSDMVGTLQVEAVNLIVSSIPTSYLAVTRSQYSPLPQRGEHIVEMWGTQGNLPFDERVAIQTGAISYARYHLLRCGSDLEVDPDSRSGSLADLVFYLRGTRWA